MIQEMKTTTATITRMNDVIDDGDDCYMLFSSAFIIDEEEAAESWPAIISSGRTITNHSEIDLSLFALICELNNIFLFTL